MIHRRMSLYSSCPLALLSLAAWACSSDKPTEEGPPTDADGLIFEDDFGSEDNPDLGGGDGDAVNGDSCVGQTAGTEASPSVLQLVVDTSGSMNQDAPGSNNSKWTVTRRALLDAITKMPGETALGVVFYPDLPNDPEFCFDEQADISIDRLDVNNSRQRNRIEEAFQDQSPDGGTPTHDAYRYAFEQLQRTDLLGRRFMVVITDGTPTFSLGCVGTGLISDPVDPSPLVTEAAGASTRGVSTFVIGSPGSEGARESLSRMAEAGGTAIPGCSHDGPNYCHFDMTEERDFAAALTGALGTISGLALSCNYDIPQPPGGLVLDPDEVNVLFTPGVGDREIIARSNASNCDEGWQYSEDGTQVLLCENTCDRVRASQGTLDLQFGCETRVR